MSDTTKRRAAQKILDGLKDAHDLIIRAKEIDPGAWSLMGTERRRHLAIKQAEAEALDVLHDPKTRLDYSPTKGTTNDRIPASLYPNMQIIARWKWVDPRS